MQQTCTEELLRRGHKTPYSFPRSHALSHSEDTPSEPSHHDDNQATGETIVLKYGFYYYSSMVQPIDQKTTNCHWKKIVPLIVPRRMGTRHAMGGGGGVTTCGSTKVGQEAGGGRETDKGTGETG